MNPPPVKRFIAGAVCPGCGAEDKLRAWRDGEVLHRECVACGFADRTGAGSGARVSTRLERPAEARGQAMTFYPRKPAAKNRD